MGLAEIKNFIFIVFFYRITYTQDNNFDGYLDKVPGNCKFDLNGDGITDYDISPVIGFKKSDPHYNYSSQLLLNFSQLWQSPNGAFTNCWDGYIGYIDNDTLLDIAGFTFSPAKFYIWEQSPTRPDSFYLVQEFIKTEGGSFGPITVLIFPVMHLFV